jgi:hypothetical protein
VPHSVERFAPNLRSGLLGSNFEDRPALPRSDGRADQGVRVTNARRFHGLRVIERWSLCGDARHSVLSGDGPGFRLAAFAAGLAFLGGVCLRRL